MAKRVLILLVLTCILISGCVEVKTEEPVQEETKIKETEGTGSVQEKTKISGMEEKQQIQESESIEVTPEEEEEETVKEEKEKEEEIPKKTVNENITNTFEGVIDLSTFPDFFIGELYGEKVFNGLLVVGAEAPSKDVIAITEIGKAINKKIDRMGYILPTALDTEVGDIKAQNAIVVGNPCDNPATAILLDTDDCHAGLSSGEIMIKLIENGDNIQMVIVGYDGQGTLDASSVLSSYERYNLEGDTVIVKYTDEWVDSIKKGICDDNIILLIDASGTVRESGGLEEEKIAALDILNNLDPTDQVGIVAFNESVLVLSDLILIDGKRDYLKEQISKIKPYGPTSIINALNKGLELLDKVKNNKNVILISDGHVPKSQEETRQTAKYVSARGIHIFTVATSYFPNELFLKELAEIGSGAYFDFDETQNLTSLFSGNTNCP